MSVSCTLKRCVRHLKGVIAKYYKSCGCRGKINKVCRENQAKINVFEIVYEVLLYKKDSEIFECLKKESEVQFSQVKKFRVLQRRGSHLKETAEENA